MSGRVAELLDLERKMAVQEDALIAARTDYEARIHGALLESLTDRWCKLTATMTDAECREMAFVMGIE